MLPRARRFFTLARVRALLPCREPALVSQRRAPARAVLVIDAWPRRWGRWPR